MLGLFLGVVISVLAVRSTRPPEQAQLKYRLTWQCVEGLGGSSWPTTDLERACGVVIAGGRLRVPGGTSR